MRRSLLSLVLSGSAFLPSAVRAADSQPPKQTAPQFGELIKLTPVEFLKRFDQNKDGVLTPDEVPSFLKRGFERFDSNKDGKLEEKEIAAMLKVVRERFAQGQGTPDKAAIDRVVANLLERFDTNKDGKLSKDEVRGPLAENFDRLDTNKDGFLDKEELRKAAALFLARQGGNPQAGQPGVNEPDFDAFDANADGRLTRDELKGTPYADKFDDIDANKDGKINRKEWKSYFKKQTEKK